MIQRMTACLLAIALWEASPLAGVLGSDLAVPAIVFSAYVLAGRIANSFTLFKYGCASVIVFFPWWLGYLPQPSPLEFSMGVTAALAIGILCWGAAELRHSVMQMTAKLPMEGVLDSAGSGDLVALRMSQVYEPLRIRHLILWTTCTAILLASFPLSLEFQRAAAARQGFVAFFLSQTIYVLIYGACLMAPLVFVWRRWHRRCFPVHPAEFLLFAAGASFAMFIAEFNISRLFDGHWQRAVPGTVIGPLLVLIPAVHSRERRWKIVCGGLAACFAVGGLGPKLLPGLPPGFALPFKFAVDLGAGLLLTPVVSDVWKPKDYSWMHRLTVVAMALAAALILWGDLAQVVR